MSDTTSGFFEDGPKGGRPAALNARDEIFNSLRNAGKEARDDMSRLWRQQARTLNRFSKALEDYSGANKPRPSSGAGIFGNLFGRAPVGGDRSTALIADLDKNSHQQSETLGEIAQLLHDDSDRQKKSDIIQRQISEKTLLTLTELLKVMRASSGGGLGGVAEGLLSWKGIKGIFGRNRGIGKTAAAVGEDAAKELTERPGFFTRATRSLRNAPKALSNAMENVRGMPRALSRTAGNLLEDFSTPRGALGAVGRGAMSLGRGALSLGKQGSSLLGRGMRLLGRGAGATLGEAAGPLAAYSLYSSASDLTNERNTPLLGNKETGLMGSRLANYAQATLSGAGVGAAVGGVSGFGVGAIPGAIAGGIAGLGTAAYADFKPQVDSFSSHVIDYVGTGMGKMWHALGGLTEDVFDKFPTWMMEKIPSFTDLKADFDTAMSPTMWAGIAKSMFNVVQEGEKWIESQFSWSNIKSLILGTPATPAPAPAPSGGAGGGGSGLPGEPAPTPTPAQPGILDRIGNFALSGVKSALGLNTSPTETPSAAPAPSSGGGFFSSIGHMLGLGGGQGNNFGSTQGSGGGNTFGSGKSFGSTGSSKPFQGSQKEFYDSTRKDIFDAATKAGLPNPGVVADIGASQSAIETGYGKHVVGNNYFGIKATGNQASVSAMTGEHLGGQDVTMAQNFAAYGGKTASAQAYVNFIKTNPRYAGLVNAKSTEEGLTALGKSGYATDPNYEGKVGSVISRGNAGNLSNTGATGNSVAQSVGLGDKYKTDAAMVAAGPSQHASTVAQAVGLGDKYKTDAAMAASAPQNTAVSLSPSSMQNMGMPGDVNSGITDRSTVMASRPPPPPPMPETNAAPSTPSSVVINGGGKSDTNVDIDQIPMFITDNGMVFLNSNAAA
jgi:hypothetical protein